MSSRKGTVDVFQTKTTRNDRFAQMSHQEKLIEQKKKEIQAKVEQKIKNPTAEKTDKNEEITKSFNKPYNQFSNDGSFLDQFKQMKDKKIDQKLKSYKYSVEKSHSDDRSRNNRWSQRKRSPSPMTPRHKFSQFTQNEPKISISTSYSNFISQSNFTSSQSSINADNCVIGQPLLKNEPPPPIVTTSTVISALPLMLNAPPPQIIQQTPQILMQQSSLPNTTVMTPPNIITSLNVPPPVSNLGPPNVPPELPVLGPENSLPVQSLRSITSVDLASIPSPSPLQLQSIPQPEPINTLNIPPPAPLQVQNIPPPSPIQLNEIPKPKPIDIINIPTPGEVTSAEKNIPSAEFIKNVPPPNKSIPPPSFQENTLTTNVNVPPPSSALPDITNPPPNVSNQNISLTLASQNLLPNNVSVSKLQPPPLSQNLSSLIISEPQVMTSQTIIVHSVPPPQTLGSQLQILPQTINSQIPLQTNNSVIPVTLTLQSGGGETLPASETNVIISQQLISSNQGQISVTAPGLNIHYPPPVVGSNIQGLQQTFITQPPPITNQMPPMNIPPPTPSQEIKSLHTVYSSGTAEYEAMASLGRMVAQCGRGIEDIVRQRKQQDPHLWFLFHKESAAYRQYQQLIEKFKMEIEKERQEKYEDDRRESNTSSRSENRDYFDKEGDSESNPAKRRRRSRWGDKETHVSKMVVLNNTSLIPFAPLNSAPPPNIGHQGSVMLTAINKNDPVFLQYVKQTYGSIDLNEEDWKKAEENYKVNLLYQEMLRKKQEAKRLARAGKHKYEYDSDEETDGGTWEHKVREKEMQKTLDWASDLNKSAEGKHHIGDFLPMDELQKFLEKKSKAGEPIDSSDYKDYKLKEDNVGFKMLQKLGWSEGQGLGANASGIVEPVNKALSREQNQGLGLSSGNNEENDDEYESYRKRMMLAYRFRPNPLNNPRRPYY